MTHKKDDLLIYEQILGRMREKETEELIDIWQTNDRGAWTDAAFQAVEQVLRERLGELPEREPVEEKPKRVFEYPADIKLFRIAEWSKRIAWATLAGGIIYSLFRFGINLIPFEGVDGINILLMVLALITSCLSYGFYFLVLQAIGEIIYLMMDIRELAHLEPNQDEVGI